MITLEELTYDVISSFIWFLKSLTVIFESINLSKFNIFSVEQLYSVGPVHELQSSWHKPNSDFTWSKYQFNFSSFFILSEFITNSIKFIQLIISKELIYKVILFFILFLNSSNVVSCSKDLNIHLLLLI